TFAAPLVCRLHEGRCVQRTPKAGFVQATAEQKLVDALELAERERRRNESKRNRLQIHLRSHGGHGRFDLLSLARAQCPELGEPTPLCCGTNRSDIRHKTEVGDGDVRLLLLTTSRAIRAGLMQE